jgi:cytochrome c553
VDLAWTTLRYAVTASVTAGSSSGQTLQGALVLRGVLQDDGSTKLTGRWVASPLTTTTTTATALAQQLQTIESSSSLRSTYRSQVAALVTALQIKLGSNGSISTQTLSSDTGRAAVAEFSQAYTAATDVYIASYDSLMTTRAGRSPKGANSVSGSISATGSVTLTIKLASGGTLVFSGTQASDGSLSGTFTGPTSGDSGTWQGAVSATTSTSGSTSGSTTGTTTGSTTGSTTDTSSGSTSGTTTGTTTGSTSGTTTGTTTGSTSGTTTGSTTGSTTTTTTTTGDATAGATKYAATCSGCHGSSTSAVSQASTLTGLNSAMTKSVHSSFASSLTDQDKLNLVAYISGN